jgi:hypothetical protein
MMWLGRRAIVKKALALVIHNTPPMTRALTVKACAPELSQGLGSLPWWVLTILLAPTGRRSFTSNGLALRWRQSRRPCRTALAATDPATFHG